MKNSNIIRMVKAAKPFLLITLLVGLLSGCAGKSAAPVGTVFFPPPPDDPHIQYLTGISDSTDIEGKKPSKFSIVLTGGEKGGVIKKIGKGFGITAHGGKLYIAVTGTAQVVIIDFANKKFEYLKGNTAAGALKKPVNLAFDKEGYLYVADTARKEIVVYDPDGNYVTAFGKGLENAKIVAVGVYEDYIYACDNKANEIKVLDRKTGEYVRSIGGAGDTANAIALPTSMYIDAAGFIYVANVGTGMVVKYDRDGHLMSKFGKIGASYSEFARPRSIAVDDAGRIYVVDAAHQNVQLFDKNARLLTFFGNPDPALPAGTLNLPAGIAVTKDNLQYFQQLAAPGFKLENVIFVLNQYGTPTLSVYGLGLMEGREYKEPEPRKVKKKTDPEAKPPADEKK